MEHLWVQSQQRFIDYCKKVDSLKAASEERLRRMEHLTRLPR